MVHDRTFILQTDPHPSLSISGSKKGISKHTTNRLQHWGTLLDYDLKVEYIPLKELGHADGLSTLIPKFNEPFEDTVIASLRSESEI